MSVYKYYVPNVIEIDNFSVNTWNINFLANFEMLIINDIFFWINFSKISL